ncbi:MAG: fumarylacetoacetase [Saprospiraceae bacterium]|nr:fumarylacetoacetase [Saprospiraceae bacterium]
MSFSIHNIPFGIFSIKKQKKRLATIINNQVVDLYAVAELGYFDDLKIKKSVFRQDFLNDFIALGKEKTNAVRKRLQEILSDTQNFSPLMPLTPSRSGVTVFYDAKAVDLHLPIKIGDYTDFYSSEQHATNVGMMFRDPANALLSNWKHIPVGYHGRASSIFVSGQNFHRPKGQINASDSTLPIFSATKRLDIELEMATIIGKNNAIGHAIDVNEAEDSVFGFTLFNDWSARDIQRWEYVPLGPFLAKNFFSSMSPWVVTIEALEPFRVPAEVQNPEVLPYLKEKNRQNFDITLEVFLKPEHTEGVKICHSNFKNMYWTVAQQIAHHTVNGCNLNIGDVMASGTISGKEHDSFGSLLELTWGGKKPISLPDGSTRTFLEDGDTITIKGFAEKNGICIDFGEVQTTVLPAH